MNDKKQRLRQHLLAGALLDSNLTSQTNQELYNAKLFNCGSFLHIYIYESPKVKKKSCTPKQQTRASPPQNKKCEEKKTRTDNALRSKLSAQRLIKANINSFNSFLTLTFSKSINDVDEANKFFNTWRTRVKKLLPDFKYLCVPEYQKRGVVHYHLLTNLEIGSEYLPIQRGKRKKYDVLYWNHGFTSAFSIKNMDNVIGYISKYITKVSDDRLYGKKRYLYSKNLIVPKPEFLNLDFPDSLSFLSTLINEKSVKYTNTYKNKYTQENIVFVEYGYL